MPLREKKIIMELGMKREKKKKIVHRHCSGGNKTNDITLNDNERFVKRENQKLKKFA